jgi:hypothetical protein
MATTVGRLGLGRGLSRRQAPPAALVSRNAVRRRKAKSIIRLFSCPWIILFFDFAEPVSAMCVCVLCEMQARGPREAFKAACLSYFLALIFRECRLGRMFRNTAFDEPTRRLIITAFDEACKSCDFTDPLGEHLAQRIVQAIAAGQRDLHLLKQLARGIEASRVPPNGPGTRRTGRLYRGPAEALTASPSSPPRPGFSSEGLVRLCVDPVGPLFS